MVDLKETEANPEKQFFEQLDNVPAGMLHLMDAGLHAQPMAASHEEGTNRLWIYAKTDSELVEELRKGHTTAHFHVVGKDHDYHACVKGTLRENNDRAKIDQFWNPIVAAWYKDGQDDPTLCLLQYDLQDGEVWGSTGSSMKFGWEIAKANLMDDQLPDVGVHKGVTFSHAA
ncbi:pyridoxamine 5'-phosphate oxidase family protein [Parvularcula maris]|uniref:Pyridoxamine 5'-phosphate oxidase family protein n=1 Tax=Parvularcula maris TaxID=2965077 RepID=A0A9X2RI58_9PROT|nr:pyridoxamine 5'-phosphate oxidase family protein [Parvularcula maris]MCQ8184606.1 pyridoxamine 5'-phosphate oxidase family protein [Parvularcula maris]